MEAALQSADPKRLPLQKFVLKKVRNRLAELETR
jgi:hypothetical protein